MSRALSLALAWAALGFIMPASASEMQPRLELGAAFQPLTDKELGALRGSGFLSDLISTLPQTSTVTVQVDGQEQTLPGTGSVTISTGTTTATATSSTTGTGTSPSFSSSTSTTTTKTFTRSFSFSF